MAGFLGQEGEKSGITEVKGTIKIKSSSSEDEIQNLHKKVCQCCPVYSMLKRAGVDIDLKWIKE